MNIVYAGHLLPDERLDRPTDVVLDAVIIAVFGMSERDVLLYCGVEPTPDAAFLDHVSLYALRAWRSTLRIATRRIKSVKRGRNNKLYLTTLLHLSTDAAYWPVREQRAEARKHGVDYITGKPLD